LQCDYMRSVSSEYLGLRMLIMSQKRLKISGYWNKR
ncbi:hypothetical protein T4A_2513, partial [Trichinella pseudospiralis]